MFGRKPKRFTSKIHCSLKTVVDSVEMVYTGICLVDRLKRKSRNIWLSGLGTILLHGDTKLEDFRNFPACDNGKIQTVLLIDLGGIVKEISFQNSLAF